MAMVKLTLLLVFSMAWIESDSATYRRRRQILQPVLDPNTGLVVLVPIYPIDPWNPPPNPWDPNPWPPRPTPNPFPNPQPQPQPQPQPSPSPSGSGVGCGTQAAAFQPKLNTRIINGNEAKPHSWPWMTTLIVQAGQGQMLCGGSLLRVKENVEATDIVLTAAHCVVKENTMANNPQAHPPSGFTVVAGNHRHDSKEKYEEIRQGAAVRFHPSFRMTPYTGANNDVAVIKLNSPIKFNEAVRPVCLPQLGAAIPSNQLCVAAGWGRNNSRNENESPLALQQLILPVHPGATCARSWPGAYKEDQMVCAGSLQAQSGVCQGDSGGMLACKQSDGRWVQYGATSWGVGGGCLEPNKPALFARVSSYVDWITQAAQQMTSL